MGNGQFGVYFVGTPSTSRPGSASTSQIQQSQPAAPVSRDYDRVLYKRARFLYSPESSVTTPVGGTVPLSFTSGTSRLLSTTGSGLPRYERPHYSPVVSAVTGRSYSSVFSGGGSNNWCSCGSVNNNNNSSSGFPRTKNLGQAYNRCELRQFTDNNFNLSKKENVQSGVSSTKLVDPVPPPSIDINAKVETENPVVANISSPACCNQYTTSPMSDFLHGTETERLIASVCHSGGDDGGTRENRSKGSQANPSSWIYIGSGLNTGKFMPIGRNGRSFLPDYGYETRESQTADFSHFSNNDSNRDNWDYWPGMHGHGPGGTGRSYVGGGVHRGYDPRGYGANANGRDRFNTNGDRGNMYGPLGENGTNIPGISANGYGGRGNYDPFKDTVSDSSPDLLGPYSMSEEHDTGDPSRLRGRGMGNNSRFDGGNLNGSGYKNGMNGPNGTGASGPDGFERNGRKLPETNGTDGPNGFVGKALAYPNLLGNGANGFVGKALAYPNLFRGNGAGGPNGFGGKGTNDPNGHGGKGTGGPSGFGGTGNPNSNISGGNGGPNGFGGNGTGGPNGFGGNGTGGPNGFGGNGTHGLNGFGGTGNANSNKSGGNGGPNGFGGNSTGGPNGFGGNGTGGPNGFVAYADPNLFRANGAGSSNGFGGKGTNDPKGFGGKGTGDPTGSKGRNRGDPNGFGVGDTDYPNGLGRKNNEQGGAKKGSGNGGETLTHGIPNWLAGVDPSSDNNLYYGARESVDNSTQYSPRTSLETPPKEIDNFTQYSRRTSLVTPAKRLDNSTQYSPRTSLEAPSTGPQSGIGNDTGGPNGFGGNGTGGPNGFGGNGTGGPNGFGGNDTGGPNGFGGNGTGGPNGFGENGTGGPNGFGENGTGEPNGFGGNGTGIGGSTPPNTNINDGTTDNSRNFVVEHQLPPYKPEPVREIGVQTDDDEPTDEPTDRLIYPPEYTLQSPEDLIDQSDLPPADTSPLLPAWSDPDQSIAPQPPPPEENPPEQSKRNSNPPTPTPIKQVLPAHPSTETPKSTNSLKKTPSKYGPYDTPVLMVNKQSVQKLKENSLVRNPSKTSSGKPRRHSDPIPQTESKQSKKRLGEGRNWVSQPELKLDNLPLTPTVNVQEVIAGKRGKKYRRPSDDETPTPPPAKPISSSAVDWYQMPSTSNDKERRESSSRRLSEGSRSSLKKTSKPIKSSNSSSSHASTRSTSRHNTTGNDQGGPKRRRSIRFTGVPPTP